MKRNLFFGSMLGAMLAVGAACAHANGSSATGPVRVAASAQDIQGCDKVTELRLQGTWARYRAIEELQSLAKEKGANVLLVSESGAPNSGVAYRCSAGTGVAGAPSRNR